jgi:hypothetical protein
MKRNRPLSYTEDEIRSFLPSGWELVDHGASTWDEKRGVLTFAVLDNVDFDWPVRVSAKEAESEGRLHALERAIDFCFRDRLGRGTRGLGLA